MTKNKSTDQPVLILRDQYNIKGDYNNYGTRSIEITGKQNPFELNFYLPRLYPREVNPNAQFVFIHRDIEIETVTRSNQYLAICGNPGYGKTHELKHLFNLLRNDPKNLVHFEKLSDYKNFRFDIRIEIEDTFDKCYLLLDGIDESNMAYVHADINKFIRNNPEWSIIVTSRTAVFNEEKFQPFKKYDMDSLSDSNIQLFIENSIPNYDEFRDKLKELDLWSKSHIPFYLNLFLEQKDYIVSEEADSKNLLDQIFEKTIERRLQPSLLGVSHALVPKIEESVKTISFINTLRNEYKITTSNLETILGKEEDLIEFVVNSSAIISNLSDELQLFDQKIQEYLAGMILQKFKIQKIKSIVLSQRLTSTLKYQWIEPLKHLISESADKKILELLINYMPHAFISSTNYQLNSKKIKKVVQYLKFEFIYYPNKIYHHTFFDLDELKVFLEKYRQYNFLIGLMKSNDQDTLAVVCKVLSFNSEFDANQKELIAKNCSRLLDKTDISISTRNNVLELHSLIVDYAEKLEHLYKTEFNDEIQVPYVLKIISANNQEGKFLDDILNKYKIEISNSNFGKDNHISFDFVSFFQNIKESHLVMKVLEFFDSEGLSTNHQDFFVTWFKNLKTIGDFDFLRSFAYDKLNANYSGMSDEIKQLVEIVVCENLDEFVNYHSKVSDESKRNYRLLLAKILNDENSKQIIDLYKKNNLEDEVAFTHRDEIKYWRSNENAITDTLVAEGIIEPVPVRVAQEREYKDDLWMLAESYESFRSLFVQEFPSLVINYDERRKACYSKWAGIDCHLIQFAFPLGKKTHYSQQEMEEHHKKHWACCLQFEALEHVFNYFSPEKLIDISDAVNNIIQNTIKARLPKTGEGFFRGSIIATRIYKFILNLGELSLDFDQSMYFIRNIALYNTGQLTPPLEYIDKLAVEDNKLENFLTQLLSMDCVKDKVLEDMFDYFVYKKWPIEVFTNHFGNSQKLQELFSKIKDGDLPYLKKLLENSNDELQIGILSQLSISSLDNLKDYIQDYFENQSNSELKLKAALIGIKVQYLPALEYYLKSLSDVESYRRDVLKTWIDESGFLRLLNMYLEVDNKPLVNDQLITRVKQDVYDCILRIVGENYKSYWKFVLKIKLLLLRQEKLFVVPRLFKIRGYLNCKTTKGKTLIRLLDDIKFRYSISGEQLSLNEALQIYRGS